MPNFLMMVGCPASGKSTYIKSFLKDNPDYVVISSDDIIDELCVEEGITYSQGFKKFIGKATSMMSTNFKNAVSQNKNIILDQTNMTVKSRRSKLNVLNDTYTKTAVVFIVDDVTLKNRLDKRAKETGKFIPMEIVNSMCNSYQSPTKAEGFDKILTVRSK